jgi:hypothetical protein
MIALSALVLLQAPAAEPPVQPALIKAQYDWGYVGADGEGKGTFTALVDPGKGRVVLEIHGLGERLVLLQGDAETGYRIQIPRQKLDRTVKSLVDLPVPFLPKLGSPGALQRLLEKGEGPGVKIGSLDALGPKKLRYQGQDEQGNDVMVWLTRTRWERQGP